MKKNLSYESSFALGLVLSIGSCVLAPMTHGSTLDLIGGGWAQATVTYEIRASQNVNPAAVQAVKDAIEDWNVAVQSISGAPTLVESSGSGHPDVAIQLKGGGGSTLGQTSLRPVSVFDCAIGSAKVLLSGKAFGQSFSAAGVGNITRHELGHVFGLGHSDDSADLMYFQADIADIFGDIAVPISNCDLRGIGEIYPLPADCSIPDSIQCR